ncbi:hypothetical protein [Listeria sp. ILCC797]|uniref:hypothetical protein n=1 Tax=Listeria sp. ILCC797 TaxID=1918333 RepID=UPI000B58DF09|nr:hypothetical protein [Listeria sp. ILCC797]
MNFLPFIYDNFGWLPGLGIVLGLFLAWGMSTYIDKRMAEDVEADLQKWKEENLAEKRKQEAVAETFLRSWLTDSISEGQLTTFAYEKREWNGAYEVCYEVRLQQKKDIRYVTISAYDMELWKKQKRLRRELENKKRSEKID